MLKCEAQQSSHLTPNVAMVAQLVTDIAKSAIKSISFVTLTLQTSLVITILHDSNGSA